MNENTSMGDTNWTLTFDNLEQAFVPLLPLQVDHVLGAGDGLLQPAAVYRKRLQYLRTGHTGNQINLLQHSLSLLLLSLQITTQILVRTRDKTVKMAVILVTVE